MLENYRQTSLGLDQIPWVRTNQLISRVWTPLKPILSNIRRTLIAGRGLPDGEPPVPRSQEHPGDHDTHTILSVYGFQVRGYTLRCFQASFRMVWDMSEQVYMKNSLLLLGESSSSSSDPWRFQHLRNASKVRIQPLILLLLLIYVKPAYTCSKDMRHGRYCYVPKNQAFNFYLVEKWSDHTRSNTYTLIRRASQNKRTEKGTRRHRQGCLRVTRTLTKHASVSPPRSGWPCCG